MTSPQDTGPAPESVEPAALPPPRLSERPDWMYLLREFYELYRHLSSGGSPRIRAHQRAVREAISRALRANARVVPRQAAAKPVTVHLRRALDEGKL
jgi:dimethylpropiothetin dethiomethylase